MKEIVEVTTKKKKKKEVDATSHKIQFCRLRNGKCEVQIFLPYLAYPIAVPPLLSGCLHGNH